MAREHKNKRRAILAFFGVLILLLVLRVLELFVLPAGKGSAIKVSWETRRSWAPSIPTAPSTTFPRSASAELRTYHPRTTQPSLAS